MNNYDASALSPFDNHFYNEPTVFRPEDVVEGARKQKHLPIGKLPAVCVLDFDGDLTDTLVDSDFAKPIPQWACFHTKMYGVEVDGTLCGIIPRTIGGPYAVLIAEQLFVSGVKSVVGMASAGRVNTRMPVPGVVVVDSAIRDEGTSYHYLSKDSIVGASKRMADALEKSCGQLMLPVLRGLIWTTDAPYRETENQVRYYAELGALAVEMQAASLLAFAQAKDVNVGMVAFVSNDVNDEGCGNKDNFDKGTNDLQLSLFKAICRGAMTV